MEYGRKAESEVAKLCGDLFLKDFVLETPKFRTGTGKLHEAADALLSHGSTLIAMQVKTRTIQGATLRADDHECRRIQRRIESAVKQVKTVKRGLDTGSLKEGETLRGARIPLVNHQYLQVVGIVIVDVLRPNGVSVVTELEIKASLSAR